MGGGWIAFDLACLGDSQPSMSDKAPQKRGGSGKPMPVGVRFGAGQKGNPGGRPALPDELREAFRALTPKALATLERVVEEGEKDSDRVRAAEVILDRAWGKAAAAPEDREAMRDRFAGLTAEALLAALGVDEG